MWRYAPVLPVQSRDFIISLGEGWTPLISPARTRRRLETPNLSIKDEGINPTGSFEARGISCAISRCAELGITKVAVASDGNAASATAAYAAAAGIEAHIFMPAAPPQANFIECKAYGAQVTLVDGPIGDCARMATERSTAENWFEVTALKEPYRIEGKKTMGYELAEQLNWNLPDVLFCPTGAGVGIIGIWKAFEEMEALGWIDSRRPRIIAVQAKGCQPIALGEFLILEILRKSGGAAVAVGDREFVDAGLTLASQDGLFVAPEGSACIAALEKLLESGTVGRDERIVIYNTGSGLKHLKAYSTRFPRTASGDAGKLGGLITPR